MRLTSVVNVSCGILPNFWKINPIIYNAGKWTNTLKTYLWTARLKVCLTIFQHHAWKQFALNQVVNLYSLSLVNTLTRVFSVRMEKANVVPVHKKSDKECLKNYWPVSMLPICGKIPERLTFNGMFRFLIESNLISSNQSGFKPGDSCINQLLFITHEICISLDDGV